VPAFIVPDELRTGALRALDVGLEPEGAQLFIAYPRDRTASAKSKPSPGICAIRSVIPPTGKGRSSDAVSLLCASSLMSTSGT
jgi:hypothetical protein